VQSEAARAVLSPADFFEALPVALAPRLPPELRGFDARRGPGRLLKLDYGEPELHFEAWHHRQTGRLEVGLHFEGKAAANRAALAFFRSRMVEVKAGLPRAELEPWDRGWARLYETLPAPELTHQLLALTAERMAAYVVNLRPMLEQFLAEAKESL
jgi:hypothetical protein